MPESGSGSAAYSLDRQTGEIFHRETGQRFFVRGRTQQVYSMLDARRGEPLDAMEILRHVYGEDYEISNVGMAIMFLRRKCGRAVVETVPLYAPYGGGPARCGYIVR